MYIKILKTIIGVTLIGIGVIGIFLPIIQGILLILLGLFLIEVKIETIKNWFRKLKF